MMFNLRTTDPLNISSYMNVKWLQEAEIKVRSTIPGTTPVDFVALRLVEPIVLTLSHITIFACE